MLSYLFLKGVKQIFATVDTWNKNFANIYLLFTSKTFAINIVTTDEIKISVMFIRRHFNMRFSVF